MGKYRLGLAYDGSGFRGFARQPGIRTVQGELEVALSKLLETPVSTTGAGRTDAGVHARGQVVSFATEEEPDLHRLQRSLNGLLGPEVVVWDCRPGPPDFDARLSATWRRYKYRVINQAQPDPLIRHFTWHVSDVLELDSMNRAAAHLVGEHDFASLCRAAEGRSLVRRVLEAAWVKEDDLLLFDIRASSFCHQMVRSVVGWAIDAGRGKVAADSFPQVLAARSRSAARQLAPPRGLILWEVGY